MAAKIAFIGGGNMAASLIGGLLQAGHPRARISVAEPSAERAAWLRRSFELQVADSAAPACAGAELVVLAVKPQQMREALAGLRLEAGCVVVSIAAGIQLASLARWLGENVHLVRSMPNTPALLGAGISGLYADATVPVAARDLASYVLGAAGTCVWLESEAQIDAVTAVSGSGPAYFFLVTEAMREAGVKLGLSPDVAGQLALQTFIGAAKMAEDGIARSIDIAQLRANVMSRGGTTEAAVRHLEIAGLRTIFDAALQAAADRGRELGASLAKET
ncbi:pyrroline-5-carboxylate reductase [Solimonas terrae]|uniref:Pyrroline-5-carboxylate reductase n=2 Tax=Solimonas terrae TaxID=1396819 RepID=A0A6M2BTC4_9GAMM|nr:pyrroline-5-carboxylate reductase [Solimonas terrae]NGY05363.1 pyrroline-5-carboxylate reductase [Solimonas terrae]